MPATCKTSDDFDATREPMRALRDLIVACETVFGGHAYEQETLRRAQDGFSALRARDGDVRPAEQIAFAAMIEPGPSRIRPLRTALQLTAGALQSAARLLPSGEKHTVTFTGAWKDFEPRTVADILNTADAALEL